MSTDSERIMKGVIPYLAIDGATKAIEFYKQAFGAKVFGQVTLMPGDTRVANVSLVINDGVMMLSDNFSNQGQPAARGGLGYTMTLVVSDGDMWWKRAVNAGCTVTTPFAKQFWGDRFGALKDPFGIDWSINEPSAENMAKSKDIKL